MRFCFAFSIAFAVLASCLTAAEKKSDGDSNQVKKQSFTFETPQRIKAGGKHVSVEAPGYACPTFADVDGDGKKDLVVGQFRNGNMQFCKNIGEGKTPEFAEPAWLMRGEKRLEVPGVW